MKTSSLLTLILVAGTAGLTAFGLADTELSARLPLEAILGVSVSLGLVHLALADYTRRPKSLPLPAGAILRPAPRRVVRVSAQVERIAA
jgi:hypothetical protein